MTANVLRGELSFRPGGVPLEGARLSVRLLAVGRVDAAARVVAERVLVLPSASDTSHPIPFELPIGPLSGRERYVIAAHLDLDGDGEVSLGDYVTMEAFPVDAEDHAAHHAIRLRRVD